MDIVIAAQHMLTSIYTATGAMFAGLMAMTLTVAFFAVQAPWKLKAAFLLVVANELRGIAIVTPIALAFFHH